MRTSRRYRFWRAGIAAIALLIAASPAPAFYWSIKSIPSVITSGNNPGNPPPPGSGNPIPDPPGGPGGGGAPGGGGPDTPGSVPEPASMAAGIIGLGIVGMRRLLRKK